MRRLDLIPPEVTSTRRRRALLRRGGGGLALWAVFWLAVLLGLHSWQRVEREAVRVLETQVDSLRIAARAVDALRTEQDAKRQRLAAVHRLAAHRPVTGVVSFVTPLLPRGLRLESWAVEPVIVNATTATPGSSEYFGAGAPAVVAMQLRGTAWSAAEVAELLRRLEASGRFRRAQLLRMDRPSGTEGAHLRFEIRCEL